MPRGITVLDAAKLQRRLWTPADLLPAAWYDAANLSSIVIATGVSDWKDLSGNGRHLTQATSTSQPAYGSASFNARPGLTFDGVDDTMATSSFTVGTVSSTFVAMTPTSVAGSNKDYVTSGSGGNETAHILYQSPTTIATGSLNLYSGVGIISGANAILLNTPCIAAGITNGSSSEVRVNGTIIVSGNAGANSWINGIRLARQSSGTLYAAAIYAEVLIFNRAVSAASRQKIEAYLAWKWGLRQRLNASNPYCNTPPLLGC